MLESRGDYVFLNIKGELRPPTCKKTAETPPGDLRDGHPESRVPVPGMRGPGPGDAFAIRWPENSQDGPR